ncbi:MAG: type II CRISPR-associated endonuclease Cas1 [Alphaproteobacteria bacterium]|nr:type II CRISPR-associated endonuclease Cas1 [Alphaproteobacteria bacterium]
MWRIIDIAQNNRQLAVKNKQLLVQEGKEILASFHFSDIHAIIIHGHGIMFSRAVLDKAGEYGIPLIICNAQHLPQTITLPMVGHYHQQTRAHAQISASVTQYKNLWRKIVQAKIAAQAQLLQARQLPEYSLLKAMVARVKSGDTENMEAQAARIYWQALFGKKFRRDSNAEGLNAHLNYGYAILRGSVARAVVAAGLLPAFGLHHANKLNPFCLVDDVIEPFRPLIDRLVIENHDIFIGDVTPEHKAILTDIINHPIIYHDEQISVHHAIQNLSTSLAQIFLKEIKELALPPVIFTNRL